MNKMISLALAFLLCFTNITFAESTDKAQSKLEYPLGSLLPDCAIYLKDPDAVSKEAFEEYASSLGFDIHLHPDFHLLTDEGFCQLCLKDERFVQNDGGDLFLTGFECYPWAWLNDSYESAQPEQEGTSFVLLLRCYSGIDYLSPLAAYLFGAYCIKNCGGVFEDFEAEMSFDDLAEIESEIGDYTDFLISEAEKGRLPTCPFERWVSFFAYSGRVHGFLERCRTRRSAV